MHLEHLRDRPDEAGADEPVTLGPCGCVDYHMADCPLVTGYRDNEPEPLEPEGWW